MPYRARATLTVLPAAIESTWIASFATHTTRGSEPRALAFCTVIVVALDVSDAVRNVSACSSKPRVKLLATYPPASCSTKSSALISHVPSSGRSRSDIVTSTDPSTPARTVALAGVASE